MIPYKSFIAFIAACFFVFVISGGFILFQANAAYVQDDISKGLNPDDFMNGVDRPGRSDSGDSDSGNNPGSSSGLGNDSYNLLFLVPDKTSGCTDTIIIINYDAKKGKVNTLSIPRDTYVTNPNGAGSRINEIYALFGINALSDKIHDLLGIRLNYYVLFDISTLKYIIDKVNGVTFDLPVDLYYRDPTQELYIDLKAGKQNFDGDKAEQLLRFRQYDKYYKPTKEQLSYYDGNDTNRVKMQISFMKEFVKQKLNAFYLFSANDLLTYTIKNTKTNVEISDALEVLLKLQKNFNKLSKDPFNSYYLNGKEEYATRSNGRSFYAYRYNGMVTDTSTGKAVEGSGLLKSVFYTNKERF